MAAAVYIGDRCKACFWNSSWLDGVRPKDIAPRIFDISKKKTSTVHKALLNNFWVTQIDTHHDLSLAHIQEFALLWEKLSEIYLVAGARDSISWKLTSSGEYLASLAYMTQFEGHLKSNTSASVWKAWAPPKVQVLHLADYPKLGMDG